jgi:hypothetical protein
MSERNEQTEGVIQHDLGIFCLCCRRYFSIDLDQFPLAQHPDIEWQDCPNAGKTYQISVLKEVNQ